MWRGHVETLDSAEHGIFKVQLKTLSTVTHRSHSHIFPFFLPGHGEQPAERSQAQVRGCHIWYPVLYFWARSVPESSSEQLPPQVPQHHSASIQGPDRETCYPEERLRCPTGRQGEGRPGEGLPVDILENITDAPLKKNNCLYMFGLWMKLIKYRIKSRLAQTQWMSTCSTCRIVRDNKNKLFRHVMYDISHMWFHIICTHIVILE